MNLQRLSMAVATSAAAFALIAVAAVVVSNRPRSLEGAAAPSSPSLASGPTTSGGMWPQSSFEEVRCRAATRQRRRPATTPGSSTRSSRTTIVVGAPLRGQVELVDRFLA